MEEADLKAWIDRAMAVRDAAMKDVVAMARPRSMLRSELPKLAPDLPDGYPEWTPEIAAKVADFFDNRASGDRPYGGNYMPNSFSLKCARIGWALAGGDSSALLPSEASFLESRRLWKPPSTRSRPASPPPAAGEGFAVEFRTSFAQPATHRSTKTAHRALASGTAWVERVAGSDAPVEWTLRGRGATSAMDVRRHGNALFRPVMRPGAAEPVEEAEFAAACASLDAWRDSPFALPTRFGTAALAEYARPPSAMSRRDHDEREAAVRRSMERAGRLLSIDGVVHRETHVPILRVAGIRARATAGKDDTKGKVRTSLCLTWEVAGSREGDPQHPMVPDGPFDWVLGTDEFNSLAPRIEAMLGFPATLPDVAAANAKRLATLLGVDFEEGAVAVPRSRVARPDPLRAVAETYARGRPAEGWMLATQEMDRVLTAYRRNDAKHVRKLATGAAMAGTSSTERVRAALASTLASAMEGAFSKDPFADAEPDADEEYALVP